MIRSTCRLPLALLGVFCVLVGSCAGGDIRGTTRPVDGNGKQSDARRGPEGFLPPEAAARGDRAFEFGEEILVGSGVRPDIAVAPDRSTHVSFVSGDAVRYRKLDGGVPGPEETVYTSQAWWPHIAVSPDNDVHVVWEKDPSLGDIWYARRVSGVRKTLRLWNNGRRAMMPRIAVDSDSRAHVVFWKDVASRLPIPRGRYLRVGLSGGEAKGASTGMAVSKVRADPFPFLPLEKSGSRLVYAQ